MQLLAKCSTVCSVPPRCFQPPPKVQSEVIRLDPLPVEQRPESALARRVESLLKQAFLARRKMLRNTLWAFALPNSCRHWLLLLALIQQRPQEVAPSAWVELARGLNQADSAA